MSIHFLHPVSGRGSSADLSSTLSWQLVPVEYEKSFRLVRSQGKDAIVFKYLVSHFSASAYKSPASRLRKN